MKFVYNKFLFLLTLVICIGVPKEALSRICVTSKLTLEKEVELGEEYIEQISVSNPTDEVHEVRLFLQDYLFNCEGENFFNEPGSHDRSNAGWVEVATTNLIVGAHSSVTVDLKIKVPKKESLEGVYWSMVFVEPIFRPKKSDLDKKKVQLQTIMRYGIQVISNIKNTGVYDFKIENKDVILQEDQRLLKFDVYNTGTLSISPDYWVEVFSTEGKTKGVFRGSRTRVYPYTSSRFLIDVTDLKPGDYNSLIIFDDKNSDYYGTRYDFSLAYAEEASSISDIILGKEFLLNHSSIKDMHKWFEVGTEKELKRELLAFVLSIEAPAQTHCD
ncbi:MAG: hypothetical protein S4CHLAM37_01010 [Chlamydiia bacterium]|nr:hypothetical protein [Chlamydiia bacterium]